MLSISKFSLSLISLVSLINAVQASYGNYPCTGADGSAGELLWSSPSPSYIVDSFVSHADQSMCADPASPSSNRQCVSAGNGEYACGIQGSSFFSSQACRWTDQIVFPLLVTRCSFAPFFLTYSTDRRFMQRQRRLRQRTMYLYGLWSIIPEHLVRCPSCSLEYEMIQLTRMILSQLWRIRRHRFRPSRSNLSRSIELL